MGKFQHCKFSKNNKCTILDESIKQDGWVCEYIRRLAFESLFGENDHKLEIKVGNALKTIFLVDATPTNLISNGLILSTQKL